MSHRRVSTIPQNIRYYLFYPCGRLTECESPKVEAALISCLVLSASSRWCRSSWPNWPSGRESRRQAEARTSWAPPSLPRGRRPTESGRRTACWWETCFRSRADLTAAGVQQVETTGKRSVFRSPWTLERRAYISHWFSLVTLSPVFGFHGYGVWRSSFKPILLPAHFHWSILDCLAWILPVRFNQY